MRTEGSDFYGWLDRARIHVRVDQNGNMYAPGDVKIAQLILHPSELHVTPTVVVHLLNGERDVLTHKWCGRSKEDEIWHRWASLPYNERSSYLHYKGVKTQRKVFVRGKFTQPEGTYTVQVEIIRRNGNVYNMAARN